MKSKIVIALIAAGLYVIAGLIASAVLDGLMVWLIGGLGLVVAIRGAYAVDDMLNG